jgi:urease accessory protein
MTGANRPIETLLALQQISDSLFPSGMFTHSLGLEQMVRERTLRTSDDALRFAESAMRTGVAASDAVAAAQAVRATDRRDVPALVQLDQALFAMKPAAELRAASVDVGRRLLEEVAAHNDAAIIGALLSEVRIGRAPGTQAVALGSVASVFGATPAAAAAIALQGTATAILQAAMRLLPVSHRDVQGALHRWRPLIARLAESAAAPERQLASFHPLQEIAAMRHETASARMFAS